MAQESPVQPTGLSPSGEIVGVARLGPSIDASGGLDDATSASMALLFSPLRKALIIASILFAIALIVRVWHLHSVVPDVVMLLARAA